MTENPTQAGSGAAPGAATPDAAATSAAATDAGDPLVGSVVADRYRISRRINEGGMGAVYEAHHTVIGKRVAIKVLLEKFHDKPDLVARLLQEARLAGSIGHENIVDVTDYGTTADGRGFVVMEFLEGESLAELIIREAPLPIERSLRIACQVASALGAAHEKGIVHRDVKPENVYLVRRRDDVDFVKVVDFGVSKAVQVREDGPEWQRLTRTGMVLGTPLYMSPEQARGDEDIDPRADVWAVGVMLYECLTAEVPFRANNYLGVIAQVTAGEVVAPAALRPELGIPPAVDAVVMRALAKDRALRYQSMGELERDLAQLVAGDGSQMELVAMGAPARAMSADHHLREVKAARPRWYLGAGAVLLVVAGVAAALAGGEDGADVRDVGQDKPAFAPRAVTSQASAAALAAPLGAKSPTGSPPIAARSQAGPLPPGGDGAPASPSSQATRTASAPTPPPAQARGGPAQDKLRRGGTPTANGNHSSQARNQAAGGGAGEASPAPAPPPSPAPGRKRIDDTLPGSWDSFTNPPPPPRAAR